MAVPSEKDRLQSLASDLERCNKCGFCLAGCPTYRVGGQMEWLATRGRVSLIQDALAGAISLEETAPAVDTRLLCNACMEHCPPKVPIGSLITGVRAVMRTRKSQSLIARLILRHLLPYPGRLRLAARLGAGRERLGLRKALTPLLGSWPTLQRAASVGPKLPGVSLRRLMQGVPLQPPGPVRARVAYYLTCTREHIFPRAAVAAVRVLVAAGGEVILPELPCCGLPCSSAGDLEGAEQLATVTGTCVPS